MLVCRGSSDAAGFLIRSWNASDEGGAAIVYDFERRYLEVIFQGESDMGSQARLEDVPGKQKRIGGDVDMREGDLLTVMLMLSPIQDDTEDPTAQRSNTLLRKGVGPSVTLILNELIYLFGLQASKRGLCLSSRPSRYHQRLCLWTNFILDGLLSFIIQL